MLEENIRIFVECVRDEMSAQNRIWVHDSIVNGRFYNQRFPSNKGHKPTKEMREMRDTAFVQAFIEGQVKCGNKNKRNEEIIECDCTKLCSISNFGLYLSFQSFAGNKENPALLKNVDIFVECVRAGITISKKGFLVEQSYEYVITTSQAFVFNRFYETAFPMNKSQKKTRYTRCALNAASEQAMRKGLIICLRKSSQGIAIKCDLTNMQSPRDWKNCHFSLPSAVKKIEKPAEHNKSIVEKIITEKN